MGSNSLRSAVLYFWHGKDTPDLRLEPPPTLGWREGLTEVDLLVAIADEALVSVEAKYRSSVAAGVKHRSDRDQVVRNVDVGSWYARGRFRRFYFVLLQFGDYPTNAEPVVRTYKSDPSILRRALAPRQDLTDADIETLAHSMAFVRWPNPA